jgi:hypothetical protein
MKIDKVIFSSSETFSVFWNVISKVYRTKLDIEPVCLFFGDRSKTNMSEEYGKIIDVPIMQQYPLLIQITWSKFFWPTLEPDKTWLIGDIDLIPLARYWFIDKIADIPDDHYVHFDADGITQLNHTQYTWCGRKLNGQNCPDLGCPTNMPAHYHCARGDVLKRGLEINGTFEEEIRHIVESGLYNNSRGYREEDPIEQHNLWCAEELRSTKALRRQITRHHLKFTPLSIRHGIDRIDGERLDKSMYDGNDGYYRHNPELLKSGKYADLHCIRPFPQAFSEEECKKRWAAAEAILKIADMI